MKKHTIIILLLAVGFGLKAQQPVFFQNGLERLSYQMDHPTAMPSSMMLTREEGNYTKKLDSIVGTNNFGWTKWKDLYSYHGDTIVEISYEQQDSEWVVTGKTEYCTNEETTYRWMGEDWEPYIKSTYEYDESGKLVLNMRYNGLDTLGEWQPSGKNEYIYGEDGLLDTCLYSSIRNGSWRETERLIYTYDDQQQCVGLLVQGKGGWGPFGNTWRDVNRYEFEYQDGVLVAELCYASSGGGWWGGGGELELDNKSEYTFDANGNLIAKTGSVFNEEDWIVRDEYTNRYKTSVDAASVQGLIPIWEAMLGIGFGPSTGEKLPLANQWLSCSVVSSNIDTEFNIYCSGFANVGEQQEASFQTYSRQGCLVVECPQPSEITVYDVLGRTVATQSHAMHCEFSLTPGLYLVSDGETVLKTVVK